MAAKMTANELRNKYLEFFKSKGHAIIPSASLIPENDPTVLFTTAGMHPLVPYLMGEKHPAGKRLVNVQKCIRTSDIDEVGNTTHHTFFEMLGNWSLGDYFKKEAIEWSWEFLTDKKWLGFDKNRLTVSVFAGDEDAPFDEEAYNIWKEIFIKNNLPTERIAKLPKKDNWWGPAGEAGPCGPDTEMFYDGVEIWNDVFMQYNKNANGKYEKLNQQNVDTGMGLERTLAVLNGLDDNYRTELFWPLIQKMEELSGKKYDESAETTRAMRIIADHIKAAVFILGDEKELTPSNVGAGYVLRRLIRRTVRYGKQLGINNIFTFKIAEEVIKTYQNIYGKLQKNKDFIVNQLNKEENKFKKTLEKGQKIIDASPSPSPSPSPSENESIAEQLFILKTQEGVPLEISLERMKNNGIEIDDEIIPIYNEKIKKHQDLSRTASAGMFKGGLADASEATIKYHTAAHLMLVALRQVLGEQISQKGSNITPERLRFDFSYGQKMTPEEIKRVEDMVNEKIKEDLPVKMEEMSIEEAKTAGATGVFESKYGKQVKVYSIGSFSQEICGGPHVEHTGILGKFKIIKEESSSAGIRRIKAILE